MFKSTAIVAACATTVSATKLQSHSLAWNRQRLYQIMGDAPGQRSAPVAHESAGTWI